MVDKRFIDTPILNEQFRAVPHASGEDIFALEENAVKAVFKISTDTNVNGKVLRDIGEKEAECSQEIDLWASSTGKPHQMGASTSGMTILQRGIRSRCSKK